MSSSLLSLTGTSIRTDAVSSDLVDGGLLETPVFFADALVGCCADWGGGADLIVFWGLLVRAGKLVGASALVAGFDICLS